MKLFCSSALAIAVALGGAAVALPQAAAAYVAIGVSVGFAPPPLPVYVQPPAPGPGYLWTPGYWAWDRAVYDYYWVPGVWIEPPAIGLYWTPAWWGWSDGVYLFHDGYWGPQVGFYGGIDYGFGYGGVGYQGGYWQGGAFFYNQAVNNVRGGGFTRVYNTPVAAVGGTHASFNGPGGVSARATAQQEAAGRLRHVSATAAQTRNVRAAAAMPALRASANRGAPPLAAASRAGQFHGSGVVKASRAGGAWNPPANPRQAQLQNRAGGANAANVARTASARSGPAQERAAAHTRRGETAVAQQGRSPERAGPAHLGRSQGVARSEARRAPSESFARHEATPAYRYSGPPRGGPEREPGVFGREGGGGPPGGGAMERRGGPPAMAPGGGGGHGGGGEDRRREGGPHR